MSVATAAAGVLKLVAGLLAVLAMLVLVLNGFGSWRWTRVTDRLHVRLAAPPWEAEPRISFSRFDLLPAPVARYLQLVLRDGQPRVGIVTLHHTGTFNSSESAESWRSFRSQQLVVASPPGFDWNARITMAPGFPVRVHDAYIDGEGLLHASLFGVATVAYLRDTAATAEGELMRFLAESPWYPTILAPGHEVTWEPVDETTARATISDRGLTVSLVFRFGADGLVEGVFAPARPRMVAGQAIPTPWEGRFWDYREQDGMRVPFRGEVSWLISGVRRPYWRGEISRLSYHWATELWSGEPPPN